MFYLKSFNKKIMDRSLKILLEFIYIYLSIIYLDIVDFIVLFVYKV